MAPTSAGSALLRARWFNGRSSRGRDVLVALAPGRKGPTLQLHVLDLPHPASRLFEHGQVEWPPQWSAGRAPRRVTVNLQDHGSLEIDDPSAWQAALAQAGARPGLAQRMQTHWPVLLAVLVLTVLALGAFFRWGTPWAAAQLSRHVPLSWEQDLAHEAMAQVDQHWLEPSRLSPGRQAQLRAGFEALLAQLGPDLKRYPSYAPRYTLLFRRGMGANAFALPGGTLVLTDGLVEAAEQSGLGDDALLGVLAHEIGHVEHRHGTRLVVEQGVLNIGLGLALGDVSSVVAMTGTLVTGLAYRRAHEAESDCFAVQLLARAQRPVGPMADLLLGLTAAPADKDASPAAAPEQGREGGWADWLSTHPATPQRAALLKAGAAAACSF